ncbi:glycoside hydrolase family 3 protein [Arthrobacter sp. L77]|uniref:glycoside hydrolase family 3 protein n=1 Tax=Arthrobacter sp. L77 TaxID=1496689 RepID=UPI0005BD6DD6|nr:glycoside hydrolase family 3 N-terminal domain-containing protein [Arthrobacter sp. L77]
MLDLSLLRLVNGVIWPGFTGREIPAWLDRELRDGLAGAVYFAANLDPDDPQQPGRLSAALRERNGSVIIGIDEEGGSVTRLHATTGSPLPDAAALGSIDDEAVTRDAGRALGAMARAAGIDLLLAPVADVNSNPRNPVIGVRSFGASTDLVSRHVAAMVDGIQEQGVGACAKHFPGHGDTSQDSHLSLPVLDLSRHELESRHLPPFQAAVDAGVRAVMSAHLVAPGFGPLPATLNPEVWSLLRSLGFDGLAVTDALDMAAIRSTIGMGAGAVQAVLAGADLLCTGNPSQQGPGQGGRSDEDVFLEVQTALLTALDDGTLAPARLEESLERRAAFTEWAGSPSDVTPPATPDHTLWIDAARRAFRFTGTQETDTREAGSGSRTGAAAGVGVIDARRAGNLATGPLADVFTRALASHVSTERRTAADTSQALAALGDLRRGGADVVVLLCDDLTGPGQRDLAHCTAAADGAVVVVNTGMVPVDPPAFGVIHTFGASAPAVAALAELLLHT